MSPVTRQTLGEVQLITIDNPPVNALGHAVRLGLVEALNSLPDDARHVIIHCAGRTFFSGADISEFGKPPQAPGLGEVLEAIETCPLPVIAAIHGQALGGGLELALACDYRIADAKARFGLPEVNLGLIPGAGGTQRLPRLAGVDAGLKLAVTGKPITAAEADAYGIIDCVSDGELVEMATEFTRSQSLEKRRLSQIPAPEFDPALFETWTQHAEQRMAGQLAPHAVIRAVKFGLEQGFDAGLRKEREEFQALMTGSQSPAMRHLFFAERLSGKPPTGVTGTARPLHHAGVIGAGTMGVGIAASLVAAGIEVVLFDTNSDALAVGFDRIIAIINNDLGKGRISEAEAAARRARLVKASDWSDFSDRELIIEAVFEDMEVKKTVLAQVAAIVSDTAIIASNTSYLDINRLAETLPHPERMLGLHFFSPAHVMKLLEIVRGDQTSDEVLVTALTLARTMKKIAVVSGVCHGFIGNRMISAYGREAGLLLLDGASPAQIDAVMTHFGLPMGPFTMADMAGLDIGYSNRKKLDPGLFEPRASLVHDRLVEMGRKGQKTGSGFYQYAQGSRRPMPDPEVEALIENVRTEAGISPREIDEAEIRDRCTLALVNEAAAILDEGIAARGSDIDVVYANGYGFPRWRGGPCCYADQLGLETVLERIEGFAEQFGARWWTPSPLLKRLADDGASMARYERL